MAWTVATDTPQIKTMYEDVGGATTSVIDTTGYDYIIFWSNTHALEVHARVDAGADGTTETFKNIFAEEEGVYKKSTADANIGFLSILPMHIQLDNSEDGTDIGNVWGELRRRATWDRGRG